jgi:hypothetical protein
MTPARPENRHLRVNGARLLEMGVLPLNLCARKIMLAHLVFCISSQAAVYVVAYVGEPTGSPR